MSARPGSGRPARSCTGSGSSPAAKSKMPMSTTWASKISLDLVADDVVDRLHLELARERLLHAVDQRQLGVPLPRLVHEPRVLERHAEAAGQRLQELLVGVGEGVLAVDVLERDHARRLAAGDERHVEHRLRHLARPGPGCRTLSRLRARFSSMRSVSACLQHVLAEADQLDRLVGEADAALDRVREVDEARGLVVDPDVDDLGVEDVLDACRRRRRRSPAARARRPRRPARC